MESGTYFSLLSFCLFKSRPDFNPHFKYPCEAISQHSSSYWSFPLMSYSEDALYCNNWTIIWYFHVLSSLTFYAAYVLVSCVSIDWKPLNGKRLAFSTCIFYHSVFIEGTHKFMFICWSSMTLVLRRRRMGRILRKRSWPTEQRVNLMKSGLFTYKFTLWILHSIWKAYPGSLSLAFFLSPLRLLLFGMCFGNANYFFNIRPKQNIIRKGDQRCIL